jgi:hypothetical protein
VLNNETFKKIIFALLFSLISVLGINIEEPKSSGCPEGTVKVPNSNICIEKLSPKRTATFKEISMYCLSKNMDICLAEQIVKACVEGSVKVPSDQSSLLFLTSSGMYLRINQDCNLAKTGPISSTEKEQFLCCDKLPK